MGKEILNIDWVKPFYEQSLIMLDIPKVKRLIHEHVKLLEKPIDENGSHLFKAVRTEKHGSVYYVFMCNEDKFISVNNKYVLMLILRDILYASVKQGKIKSLPKTI